MFTEATQYQLRAEAGKKTEVNPVPYTLNYDGIIKHLANTEQRRVTKPVEHQRDELARTADYTAKLLKEIGGQKILELQSYIGRIITALEKMLSDRIELMSGADLVDEINSGPGSTDEVRVNIPSLIARLRVVQDLKNIPAVDIPKKLREMQRMIEIAQFKLDVPSSPPVATVNPTHPEQANSASTVVPERKGAIVSKEHIIYHPNVVVFGDQHGDIELPKPGERAVYVGDILDIKEANEKNFDAQKFPQDLDAWLTLVESGEATFVLGNHDMKLLAVFHAAQISRLHGNENGVAACMNWLSDGGSEVLKALNIPIKSDLTKSLAGFNWEDAKSIVDNPLLLRFAKVCKNQGKLYAVVNENFVSHTLPITTEEGHLAEIEDGLSGMDALDILESRIRSGGDDAAETVWRLYLTEWEVRRNNQPVPDGLDSNGIPKNLTREDGGPVWNRNDGARRLLYSLEGIEKQKSRIANVMGDLNVQAIARGTRVNRLVSGHISSGGTVAAEGQIVNIDYADRYDKKTNGQLRSKLGGADGKTATVSFYDDSSKVRAMQNRTETMSRPN